MRISWDEALGEISSRWRRVIARRGPQAIWPYYGTRDLDMTHPGKEAREEHDTWATWSK